MITILIICAVVLFVLAFWMGDTSLGGPAMVVQVVLALAGVGCLVSSLIIGVVRLFA